MRENKEGSFSINIPVGIDHSHIVDAGSQFPIIDTLSGSAVCVFGAKHDFSPVVHDQERRIRQIQTLFCNTEGHTQGVRQDSEDDSLFFRKREISFKLELLDLCFRQGLQRFRSGGDSELDTPHAQVIGHEFSQTNAICIDFTLDRNAQAIGIQGLHPEDGRPPRQIASALGQELQIEVSFTALFLVFSALVQDVVPERVFYAQFVVSLLVCEFYAFESFQERIFHRISQFHIFREHISRISVQHPIAICPQRGQPGIQVFGQG